MAFIVKNTTGEQQSFLGIKLPAGGERDIKDYYTPFEIAHDTVLIALIQSGDIVINTGSADLTPSEAAEVISGTDPYNGFVVLDSDDGTKKFKLTVDNAGVLATQEV